MSKRTSLAVALHDAGAKPVQMPSKNVPIESESTKEVASEAQISSRPPSRVGLRAVTVYVKPEAHKQLRLMAIDQGDNSSVQELMIEAINDLFKKHGRSIIA
jgi:predicted HicB family RNase H-like nuclease